MPSASSDRKTPVAEFKEALRDGYTYRPWRNSYAAFGFLWGLPIPIFSIAIDLWASQHDHTFSILFEHPIHFFFLLHPALFSVVFGAMGTVRRNKDFQIARLVAELQVKLEELEAANEKLKELDRMKAQFMANVTHELKTPLVSIRGYTESLVEGRLGPLTEKQREGMQIAMNNVDRLQKLIEQLLEFERLDAGEFKLHWGTFDVIPLIHGVLRTFQPQIDSKRLSVQLRLPPNLWVHADGERIHHVLLNLVSNAVKFSPEGSAVGVGVSQSEEDGSALITVWDRGPGIPTAAQKYLFTRFWQADGSMSRKHGGTGLGLAIVKAILDAHGSTIQVVSTEDSGTSVHFSLALAGTGQDLPKEAASAAKQT